MTSYIDRCRHSICLIFRRILIRSKILYRMLFIVFSKLSHFRHNQASNEHRAHTKTVLFAGLEPLDKSEYFLFDLATCDCSHVH